MNREDLLSIGIFIENDYFEKYFDLITDAKNQKIKYKHQTHHIIPRIYYNHFNLPIDNSENNTVVLTHYEHALAHLYLWGCSKYDWFAGANALAVNCVLNTSHIDYDLQESEKLLIECREDFNACMEESIRHRAEKHKGFRHTEESKKKLSDALKLYHSTHPDACKGRPITEETREKMSRSAKLRSPTFKGKHHSDESKEKISIANKGRPVSIEVRNRISETEKMQFASGVRKSWNTGQTKETNDKLMGQSLKLKDGYKKGLYKRTNNGHAGRIYINNGIEQKFILAEELTDWESKGYVKGKLHPRHLTEEDRRKISEGMRKKYEDNK